MKIPTGLPPLLESFFTKRLMAQRKASPHTIAAYRDTFSLLLKFAQKHLGREPSKLLLEDLDAAFISVIPRPSGGRSPLLSQKPECTVSSDPLVLPIRGRRGASTCWVDPTCALDPEETPRSTRDRLPDPRRDQGSSLGRRPNDVARSAGSRDPPDGGPNGPSPLRNYQSVPSGCRAGGRSTCPMHGQRPQRALYALEQTCGGRVGRMDEGRDDDAVGVPFS